MDWGLLTGLVAVVSASVVFSGYSFARYGLKGAAFLAVAELALIIFYAAIRARHFVSSIPHVTINEHSVIISLVLTAGTILITISMLSILFVTAYRRFKNRSDNTQQRDARTDG